MGKRRSPSAAGGSTSKRRKTRTAAAQGPATHAEHAEESPDSGSGSRSRSGSEILLERFTDEDAMRRWPSRYNYKRDKSAGAVDGSKGFANAEELTQAKCHFSQAKVDSVVYNLYDNAYVQGEVGKQNYICKIIEIFQGIDGVKYFRAQWYYRAQDTVILEYCQVRENKRIFLSDIQDDNPLDCLVRRLHIINIRANVDVGAKMESIPECDYYFDMKYSLQHYTFLNSFPDDAGNNEDISTISNELEEAPENDIKSNTAENCQSSCAQSSEMRLLDLYAGCGAMSTGLCLGAKAYGVNLITKWAIDINEPACESLRLNHPEIEVRNESVDDFLALLKEWEKLCMHFSLIPGNGTHESLQGLSNDEEEDEGVEEDNGNDESVEDPEVFEVERILAICYGDPNKIDESGLYFKVRWKGYGSDEDTWEPIKGLSESPERIKEFVIGGFKEKLLPLPGDVDAICGGPPCQGISGFNRFRKLEDPLSDPKNKQLMVYMDVVDFLKPKFVLMENVVDLVKLSKGHLGRYAMGRLVDMNYQARMGMMAAGSYGLPQFRMRVFVWAARPTEVLPQYALPTHEVVNRGVTPVDFEKILVAYKEDQRVVLEPKLCLEDAISDLPEVKNDETRNEMDYGMLPRTNFQHIIKLKKGAYYNPEDENPSSIYNPILHDHRPLNLNKDDFDRVCWVPKKKGANFRDFPGIRVNDKNKVEWIPGVPKTLLPSKKPLVPDYAMTFVNGTSSKPFGRLWWDETVPTVVGRAEPHNQAIIHPKQDRVLTIRENARLQGFPDYYKLCGPVKERYIQVGNAVAVPVARALGYGLAKASQRDADSAAVFCLPPGFPDPQHASPSTSEDQS